MSKIDVVSGFLGAGKTTLIKKLLKESFQGEQVVLIENEFGEIGIDGGFLKDAGIEIKEMNSGCICCSLVGDFGTSLKEVIDTYKPDRVLIEPSGVGKLSDVLKAVEGVMEETGVALNAAVAVVDATKCKTYLKNFGEFFANQIEYAGTIILSRTDKMTEEKLKDCVEMIREHNEKAAIITTPWDSLKGEQILEAMEHRSDFQAELLEEVMKEQEHHHEHGEDCNCGCHDHHHEGHDNEHEEHAGHEHGHGQCGHHHDHEGCGHGQEEGSHHHGHGECAHHHHENGECCHNHEEDGHHHHENGECCHNHEEDGHHHHHENGECHHSHEGHAHHHEHGESCSCGHDHSHGHHHADEVFTSWGMETPRKFTKEQILSILEALEDKDTYGFVLRAKGMVAAKDSERFLYFDYVPAESEVRDGNPEYTGKICVIGSKLQEENLKKLFA